MVRQFLQAVRSYSTAIRFMTKRSLWHWQIVPGLISFLFGALVFGLAYQFGDNLGNILSRWYPWEFGRHAIGWLFMVLGKILIVVTGLFLYRYILLIVISPMLSLLSEKVEEIYRNDPDYKAPSLSLRKMARDMRRGIYLTLRNMVRELSLTIGLFGVSFIPGAAVFTTPLTFGVQSFYAGFGNMDFTMERYMNISQRIRFVRANKGLAVGNGLAFIGLLMIPVIGLFLAPTLGVIAATIDVLDELDA